MNIFKYWFRLFAVKHRKSRKYRKCRLCNQLIFPNEKMYFVYRWAKDMQVVKICYCENCVKSRKDGLNEVDTDSILYGIAYVDDYYNFKKKDYTRYLRRKERENN